MGVLVADINDTNNTLGKLANEWERLEAADIDDRDRRVIREFVEHRRDIEDCAANTLIGDLGNLRRASKRAPIPLVEMEMADARGFLTELITPKDEGGYGLAPDGGGIYGYKRAMRVLFKFLDEERDTSQYAFYERLELPSQSVSKVEKTDLLTEDELGMMKRAAQNPRDRALFDFLADVGARISLATSLRLGDINNIDTGEPSFVPNENAVGLKGVELKEYPILHSRAELRAWMNQNHPDPHPDAPLWPVRRGYSPSNREDGAVSTDAVRSRLSDCRRWAGIEKDTRPHNFRHIFMTRIANSDLSDRQIKHMSMLTDNQLRMIDVYDHTSDEERNRGIQSAFGYVEDTPIEEDEAAVELVSCPNCLEQARRADQFCPRCATPLDEETREAVRETQRATSDAMVSEDERSKRAAAREMADQAESDAELAELLIEELRSR